MTMKCMKILSACSVYLDTKADTQCEVIKDLLIRCNLPLALCRGQAYKYAEQKGVATQIKGEQPAAISVHCFAHSLNLCLQEAGRSMVCLRDALELCREVFKLIELSPKRSYLFSMDLRVVVKLA